MRVCRCELCWAVGLLALFAAGAEVPVAQPRISGAMGFSLRPCVTGSVGSVTLVWSDGAAKTFPLKVEDEYNGFFTNTFADAALSVGAFARQYVRPRFKAYQSEWGTKTVPAGIRLAQDWNNLPSASRHTYRFDFAVSTGNVYSVWIDGSYAGDVGHPSGCAAAVPAGVSVSAVPSAEVASRPPFPRTDVRFEALDLAANPRAGAFAAAWLEGVAPGPTSIRGVPMDVAPPSGSQDAACCKAAQKLWKLTYDEYRARSPQDGYPAAIHFRIRPAQVLRAYLLVAFDPAPGKSRKFSVLQSAYNPYDGAGLNKICQTDVDFGAGVPSGFEQVGSVRMGETRVPLYFGGVDFDLGPCVDLVAERGFIDIEVNGTDIDGFEPSGANVFAVTLEKSPVHLLPKPRTIGNIFSQEETDKRTDVVLEAVADFEGRLAWSVGGRERSAALKLASGARTSVTIDLSEVGKVGLYDLPIRLVDAAGRTLITHAARFCVTPPVVRLWDADITNAPYFCWWFTCHGIPGDVNFVAPLIRKAGVRKIGYKPLTEEEKRTNGFTSVGIARTLPWKPENFDRKAGRFLDRGGKTGEQRFVEHLQRQIDADGRVDRVLVWHEDAPANFIPEEILGLPVPAATEEDREAARYVNACGELIRKHFPGLRIEIGNWVTSLGAAVLPLRGGANPDYYDAVSVESGGWTFQPERLLEVPMASLMTREAASKAAGRPVRVNGCWEYTSRNMHSLSPALAAAYNVRDVVIGLRQGFDLLHAIGICDVCNGYFQTRWGRGGCVRAPFCYPREGYMAAAVMTKCLDRVTFVRSVPTGSATVYAEEFRRADDRTVTVLWTARGEAVVSLGGAGRVVSMLGEEDAFDAVRPEIRIGAAPVYAFTEGPLSGVKVVSRTYPEVAKLLADGAVLAALDDPSRVALVENRAYHCDDNHHLPIYKASDAFSVEGADDPEMGRCLAVRLDTSRRPMNRYMTEYTTLRLAKPVPIPDKAKWIGLRVKGNSNWGQIRFEVEDADGKVFRFWKRNTGLWSRDGFDWPGSAAVNFDGWGAAYYTLEKDPLSCDIRWYRDGGKEPETWRKPLKIKEIMVSMNREALDLSGFRPAEPVLFLKDLFWSAAPEVRNDIQQSLR